MEAFAIGTDVPSGCFPVEIHSIFRTAINLIPGSGGNLIMILGHEHSDHPQGVRLTRNMDFTDLCMEPKGKGIFYENGIILDRSNGKPSRQNNLDTSMADRHKEPRQNNLNCAAYFGAAPKGNYQISFAKAMRVKMSTLPRIGHLGTTWKTSVDLLGSLQEQAGTDLNIRNLVGLGSASGALGIRLAQAALILGESVRNERIELANLAVSRLVGLGLGLTPSGDDFLCGFLSAAYCRLGEPSENRLFRELKQAVLACLSSTNDISATFLRCAADGRVSKALQDLAEAFQTGDHTERAVIKLCAFGHSSGMDIATGFVYGLDIWDKEFA